MVKKGPPYLKNPHATFLVIGQPWPAGRPNINGFINNVGAWLRFMGRGPNWTGPQDDVLCNVIYTRRSEDTIIVQLPDHIDVSPYLGVHKWAEFLKPHAIPPGYNENVSYIFEYNYRNQGDPSNHSWSEGYPIPDAPPPEFPVIHPYPPPTYALKPISLSLWAKSMPEPIPVSVLQPEPLNEEKEKNEEEEKLKPIIKTETAAKKEDLETPDHKSGEASRIPHSSSSLPLKREPNDTVSVKQENAASSSYQPSDEYLSSLASLQSHHLNRAERMDPGMKAECDDQKPLLLPGSDYEPIPELVGAIQDIQVRGHSRHETHRHVKEEHNQHFEKNPPDTRKRLQCMSTPPVSMFRLRTDPSH